MYLLIKLITESVVQFHMPGSVGQHLRLQVRLAQATSSSVVAQAPGTNHY